MLAINFDTSRLKNAKSLSHDSILVTAFDRTHSAQSSNPIIVCVILIALRQHGQYPFILAANRDEYYQRPTTLADFWDDHPSILAGRDLQAHGTWLGVSRTGKIAAITNHHTPLSNHNAPRSRGELVNSFLLSDQPMDAYIEQLHQTRNQFNGYGLLVGNQSQLRYQSNRSGLTTTLSSGVHALSNSLLNSPWPRVQTGKQLLTAVVEKKTTLHADHLFEILSIRSDVDSGLTLPDQWCSIQPAHLVNAPIFVRLKEYGTRSSTVVLIDRELTVYFEERTFNEISDTHQSRRQFQFQITASDT